MKNKRILSFILMIAVLFATVPLTVFADTGEAPLPPGGTYPANIVTVVTPAYHGDISGDTWITFYCPGAVSAAASAWHQPDEANPGQYGYSKEFSNGPVNLDANGYGAVLFPAGQFPHGPTTVLIKAKNSSGTLLDTCYLQLYNTSGVSWNEGLSAKPVQAGSRKLVFADDFIGMPTISHGGIGATYNSNGNAYGDAINGQLGSSYNPFVQKDTYMILRATGPYPDIIDPNNWNRKYVSGELTSVRSDGTGIMAKCGYFEIRAMLPEAVGTWPAFWTTSFGGAYTSEYDIFEGYGNWPNTFHTGHIEWTNPQTSDAITPFPTTDNKGGGGNVAQTFHTYGMQMNPTTTYFYLDGILYGSLPTTENARNNPFGFLINNELGSGWPIDLSRYNGEVDMCIDWVRVYGYENDQIPTAPEPVPTAIQVNETSTTMEVGDAKTVKATVFNQEYIPISGIHAAWSSSNPAAATVDSAGNITAVAVGTTVVTATYGSLSASVTVTVVEAKPKLIRVDSTSAPYGGQGPWKQNTKYSFYNFSEGGWWSDSWGYIYTAYGSAPQYVDFSFTGTSIALYMTKHDIGGIVNIYLDGTLQGSVDTYTPTWTKAKVFEKGALSAQKHTLRVETAGKSITGNAYAIIDGFEYMTTGTTPQVATSISVDSSSAALKVGESKTVNATVRDQNNDTMIGIHVDWSSSDPSVATVDSTGKITAVTPGTAIVKAAYLGLSANVNVTVAQIIPELLRVDYATAPYGGQGSWSQNTKYPFFTFSGGGWWSDSWSWMYNGVGNLNDYVDFSFTGTSIALYMKKLNIGGIVKIFVDGVEQSTVDTYSAQEVPSEKVFEKGNLPAGAHKIRVQVAGKSIQGNAYVLITGFEYMSSDSLFKPKNPNMEIGAGENVTVTILRNEEARAWAGTYDLVMPATWSVVSGKDFAAGSAADNIVIHIPDNYADRYGEINITAKSSTGDQYGMPMTIKFTNSSVLESVIFGNPPIQTGISVWTGDGSGYTVETYDGKSGWQTKPGYGIIYGNVDDNSIYDGKHKVAITLEYFDAVVEGRQSFGLSYDGVLYAWSGGPDTTTYLTGTNTWKTVTYTIDDVKFANRENGGDFRIQNSVPICFHSITVKKIPIMTVDGGSSKTGNIFLDNETPAINLSFGNQFSSDMDLTVNYYVFDYTNSVVNSGNMNITVNAYETGLKKALTFGTLPKGTYTLAVNARNSDGSINLNEKYNFSVISDLTGKNVAPFLGMNTHYSVSWANVEAGLPLIKQSGTTALRDGRAGAGATMDKIVAAGNKLLTGYGLGQPDGDGTYTTWANGVAAYANEVKGKAEYFEIGNEPNGSTTPEEYMKMLKAAYPAVKGVDPAIKVVCGVAFGYDSVWLKKLIDLGALDYSDSMSFHMYTNQNPENEGLVHAFQDLKDYIGSKGITKDVELLLTETGYATQEAGWGGLSEIMSASYAAQLYVTGFVNNGLIHRIYWYDFMNDGTDPTYYETNGGIVRADLTAKPSYVAFNAASGILAGAEYVTSYNTLDSNIRIYKFHRASDNKDILVLWANQNDQYINLNLGSSQLRIADIFGNYRTYDAISNSVALMASPQPVYIEGNFTQAPVLGTTPAFAADATSVTVAPGNDVTINITRAAGAENLSGTYAVNLPAGWQLKSGGRFSSGHTTDTLVFTAPEETDISTGEIQIVPTSTSGNIYGILKVQIIMTEPSLTELSPQLNAAGTGYDLAVKITNGSNTHSLSGGTVTVLEPANMAGSMAFEAIAPNSAATVKFAVPSLDRYTPVHVKVRIDRNDGSSQVIERNLTSLTAVKTNSPIQIDGVYNTQEWNNAMTVTLDQASQVKGMADWGGPDDLSAVAAVKWDTNYLYLDVQVKDANHSNTYPPAQNWAGDSLQFSIDPGRAQGPGILPHTENNIALRSDTGEVTKTGGFGAGGLANSIVSVKRDEAGQTTNYEMAIGWADILPAGIVPASGTDIGLSFLVNDNDGNGRRGWIEYMSGIGASKDPTLYGDLVLTNRTTLDPNAPAAATSIAVDPASATLKVGDTRTVNATVLDQNENAMSGITVDWSSNNPAVATVDSTGKITAVAIGTTIVKAVYGSLSANVNVTVSDQQAAEPSITLEGPGNIAVDGIYTLTYGLKDAQNISAEDITVKYDGSMLEYVDCVPADSDKTAVTVDSDNPGVLRIVLTHAPKENAISGTASILNIKFKALKAGTATLSTDPASIADGDNHKYDLTAQKAVTIGTIVVIDRTALNNAISAGQALLNAIVEGYQIGQYPEGTKAKLQSAIDTATSVLNNQNASQADLNAAAVALNSKADEIRGLKITAATGDVNGDGEIDVRDLGSVAWYYGISAADPDWNKVKAADIKQDGEIDLYDLAFVAKRIIGK